MDNMEIKFIVSSIVGIATFIWTAYRYFDTRKREQDLKEFENYHKLIKELVEPSEKGLVYADRQAAIIYELKNFKRYYPFSYRTLIGLQEKSKKLGNPTPRVSEELELTIKFLERYKNKF